MKKQVRAQMLIRQLLNRALAGAKELLLLFYILLSSAQIRPSGLTEWVMMTGLRQ